MTVSNIDTVLVQQSDARLAAVEEAKRTGLPLESIGANGSNVVPYEVAVAIADEKALQNTYVGQFGLTHAAHLADYHAAINANPNFVAVTNEEKAAAHEAYSAQLVRDRMAVEARVKALMAEGYDVSLAVQQANLERAQAHEKYAGEYEKYRQEREKNATPVLEMVDEAVKLVNSDKVAADATVGQIAQEMMQLSSVVVPDAMEAEAEAALVRKDQIISTELPYEPETATPEKLNEQDRPALVVLSRFDSPEALEEGTVDAQIAANNPTRAALLATQALAENADEEDSASE